MYGFHEIQLGHERIEHHAPTATVIEFPTVDRVFESIATAADEVMWEILDQDFADLMDDAA
jgi:hypothetical protein